jgi:hyperosmotically inducible periplasmic protein
MENLRPLMVAFLIGMICVGSGCSPKAEEETKEATQKIEDKAQEIAGDIADKSKEIVSATGEAINDGWITTKVKAKFADEKLLKDSKIDVDTKDRVVTLKGTVASAAAKTQAMTIARGTEGVLSVVDELAVRTK